MLILDISSSRDFGNGHDNQTANCGALMVRLNYARRKGVQLKQFGISLMSKSRSSQTADFGVITDL